MESAEGVGTTVSLFLPRSRAALLRPELETASSIPCRVSGTILLAEDNDEVAEVTAGMLEGLGYSVARVSSSQQALEYLDSGRNADLVLTDIVMPGGSNGVDLARIVRERYPTLPVILTTGYSAAAREAAHEGFFILSKPYRIAALESSLRNALDRTPFPAQEGRLRIGFSAED